ncbi:MAG: DUF4252 domain-containing protein [Bacteroidota bacterium]
MKPLAITFIALLACQFAFGQNVIEHHFPEYLDQEDVVYAHLPKKMFEMAAYLEVEEENADLEELRDFLSTIKALDLIVKKEEKRPVADYEAVLKKIQPEFEELMSVKDDEETYGFYINENNGIVKELVMVGMGGTGFILMSLSGDMRLNQIFKVARFIKSDEYAQMKKLNESGIDKVKVYPNPTTAGNKVTVDVPESLIGGTAKLITMKGEVIRSYSLESTSRSISTHGLATGMYIISLENDKVSIKKRVTIQ